MRRRIAAAGLLALLLIVGSIAVLRLVDEPPRERSPSATTIVAASAEIEPTIAASEPTPPPPEIAPDPAVTETPAPVATPPVEPAPPVDELVRDLPGIRFEARFADWRPPRLTSKGGWRIVGYRESVAGCRRVGALPLGRGAAAMAYRSVPVEDPAADISIAAFFIAIPIDERGNVLAGHLTAHAAEAHFRLRDLERDPTVDLRALATTVDFDVLFEDAPPDLTARGWFAHIAPARSWPAAELPTRLPRSFPARPEAFADEAGWLRFSGARIEAPISPLARIEVTGWPRGMLWPESIELRASRDALDVWTFAGPESARAARDSRESDLDPLPATLHRYVRRPESPMPPIEVVPSRSLRGFEEDALVIVDTPWFAAEARLAGVGKKWVWSMLRGEPREGQRFRAVLLAPGLAPTTADGHAHTDRSLVFRIRPAEAGAILAADLVVAPGLRLDIPVFYELELECGMDRWRSSGAGIARNGIFTLGSLPDGCTSRFEVEVDVAAWGRRLERAYHAEWRRPSPPLEVRAEVIGETATGATVLEVIVVRQGEEWPLAEFLEEFGISP